MLAGSRGETNGNWQSLRMRAYPKDILAKVDAYFPVEKQCHYPEVLRGDCCAGTRYWIQRI
jgi:hypothetical protein